MGDDSWFVGMDCSWKLSSLTTCSCSISSSIWKMLESVRFEYLCLLDRLRWALYGGPSGATWSPADPVPPFLLLFPSSSSYIFTNYLCIEYNAFYNLLLCSYECCYCWPLPGKFCSGCTSEGTGDVSEMAAR